LCAARLARRRADTICPSPSRSPTA
jgi:hypothetical protein